MAFMLGALRAGEVERAATATREAEVGEKGALGEGGKKGLDPLRKDFEGAAEEKPEGKLEEKFGGKFEGKFGEKFGEKFEGKGTDGEQDALDVTRQKYEEDTKRWSQPTEDDFNKWNPNSRAKAEQLNQETLDDSARWDQQRGAEGQGEYAESSKSRRGSSADRGKSDASETRSQKHRDWMLERRKQYFSDGMKYERKVQGTEDRYINKYKEGELKQADEDRIRDRGSEYQEWLEKDARLIQEWQKYEWLRGRRMEGYGREERQEDRIEDVKGKGRQKENTIRNFDKDELKDLEMERLSDHLLEIDKEDAEEIRQAKEEEALKEKDEQETHDEILKDLLAGQTQNQFYQSLIMSPGDNASSWSGQMSQAIGGVMQGFGGGGGDV